MLEIIFVYSVYYMLSLIPLWYPRRFYKYTYWDYQRDKQLDKKRSRTFLFVLISGCIQAAIAGSEKDILAVSRDYNFLILSAMIFIVLYTFIALRKLSSWPVKNK